MVKGKSLQALKGEGYLTLRHKDFGDDYWAVNTSHPLYIKSKGDLRRILRVTSRMAAIKLAVPFDLLWARVKNPTEYGENCYFPISAFKRRDEWKNLVKTGRTRVLSWDRMLSKEKQKKQADTRDRYRAKNLPFFRMYMMGDPTRLINCPLMGFNIDEHMVKDKLIAHRWQQHHIPYDEGTSLNKEGDDPGRNNCTTDLTVVGPKSERVLKDTAGTIFVSATGHEDIHKYDTKGDVSWYSTEQLPFALQSKENWDKWRNYCREYGHDFFPEYHVWMYTLTLDYFQSQSEKIIDPQHQPA